jgi:hypothetical protein
MPTATDLVTDLPADFEVFGQAVDTALMDLKGGTSGQVLKKNSNTDMDFVWGADSAGMTNPMTTTGDTIYSSSGSTPARLGIGTAGQVLKVNSGATAPEWGTAGAADDFQLINAGGTALTGATTITVSGISSKNKLMIYVMNASSVNASYGLSMRFNSDSGANYTYPFIYLGAGGSGSAQSLTDSEITVGESGNNATNRLTFVAEIQGTNATGIKPFNLTSGGADGGTTWQVRAINGFYSGTSAISSVSIISNSGNFDAGTVYVYGA